MNNERIRGTHVFKAIFAELCQEMQEPQDTEPGTPQNHFIHGLDIHHTKDKDKFVKHKIPKFVLDVLLLWDTQLPKHQALDEGAKQDEDTVRYVDQSLWKVNLESVSVSHWEKCISCNKCFF